jgi:hypothetical protein
VLVPISITVIVVLVPSIPIVVIFILFTLGPDTSSENKALSWQKKRSALPGADTILPSFCRQSYWPQS